MAERGVELVIYRGLPASGKTTAAKAWVAQDPANRARVNRDDLRSMLHAGYVDGPTEHRQVSAARDALIERLLRAGVSVVSDDTNLPQKVARSIAEIGWRVRVAVRVVDLTGVGLDECLRRDPMRVHPVGPDVIRGMHDRFLAGGRTLEPLDASIETGSADVGGYLYQVDDTLPSSWLCDIDGTLALMEGRSPFEWHRVGEDACNEAVREVVWALQTGYKIVLLSGRDGVCRPETEAWLAEHEIDYDALFMRAPGDTRKDSIVKLELLREVVAPRYHVRGVLDDRDQVVEMWRSVGLTCLQVAPGAF